MEKYKFQAKSEEGLLDKALNELGWKAEKEIDEMCKDSYNYVQSVKKGE